MVQTSRKVGGQRAPRSNKVRTGSVANASRRANLPEAIINSTASPGVGILIDPGKIMAKDNEPYYVVIDGKRIYGSSADNVIEKISGITNVSEAPLNRNGESGVGSLINVKKAKEGSPDKYYIVIKGKRYYGNSQEKAIEVAKSANHGSRTWKQYRKHVGNKVRKGLSSVASSARKGLSSAASSVSKRMTRTRNASVARTNRSKTSRFRNPFKRKRSSVAPVNNPMNATSTANSSANSSANSTATSNVNSTATSNANSTANSTNTSSANNMSANNSSSTTTV